MNEQEVLCRLFGDKAPDIFGGGDVKNVLIACEALWMYPGEPDPNFPHALLTSGQHSDGFANVGVVLKECPTIRRIMARSLLRHLDYMWRDRCNIDWVIGADTSSTDLAYVIALITGARHVKMIKTEDEQGKRQVWSPGNIPLRDGEVGIHIEELVTTSSSALQVRRGIRLANPDVTVTFAPFVPVIVDRSNPDQPIHIERSSLLPLLRLEIRNYDPNSCPYCAVGSIALKPKEGDNWSKLTER